jgi:hypothetical protein
MTITVDNLRRRVGPANRLLAVAIDAPLSVDTSLATRVAVTSTWCSGSRMSLTGGSSRRSGGSRRWRGCPW